jgi:translocation and assembly module TamB
LKAWLRRALWAALALVTALGLGVFLAWQYLTSEAGAERVRGLLLGAAGESLAGSLQLGRLSLRGGVIVVEDLRLYTPEHECVAELERAELHLRLGALLSRNVVLSKALIEGLRLDLQSDERGLNLNRAVAAKRPSPPSGGPPPAVRVEVQELALEHGHLSWQQEYTLEDIGIAGTARVGFGEHLELKGQLEARGALSGEPVLPLQLSVSGDQEKLGVALWLGEGRLDGDFSLEDLSARIAELFVPPSVAERFTGELPLKVPVTARGAASVRAVQLQVEAGKARLAVDARLDGATVPSFELHASDVDLAELLGRGQPSQLSIDSRGRLSNLRLESFDAALLLDAKWSKVGTLQIDADAKQGQLNLKQLALEVPGGTLDARGTGDSKALELRGALDATDLSQLAKVIAEVTGAATPRLAGHGQVKVALEGAVRHPRLSAWGRLPTLHLGELGFQGVAFDGGLADVTRPFEAQLHAEVARLVAAERSFDEVRVNLDTRGRDLDLSLSTRGYAELSLKARGRVDPGGEGVALATLTLHWPEEDWTLESPTHLSLAEGVVVEPLTLRSAEQRIALEAKLQQGRIAALLDAKNVELTRLPHAFVPTRWGLGGRLDAHLTAAGRSAAPDTEASLTWRDGSVRTLRDLQLSANLRYANDRAALAVDGTSDIGEVRGSFDLPLTALSKPSGEPLTAAVTLRGVALDALGPLLEVDLPATGRASVKLDATGTAAHPHLTAHAEVHDGRWTLARSDSDAARALPIEQAVLDVRPGDDGALGAVLTLRALGADAAVKLTTPLKLEELRRRPPTVAALRETPVQLQANVQRLQLEALHAANLLAIGYQGSVSVALEAKGSLDHPDITGTASFAQLKVERLKPLDVEAHLVSGRTETRLDVEATARSQPLGQLRATAAAPLEALADLGALGSVAVDGHGDLGPFALDDVLQPNPDQTQPRGRVKAAVDVGGTPVDPEVKLDGTLEQLALGKVALGRASLSYAYQRAVSTFGLKLLTGGSGALDANGTLQLDLSQPAVLKGLEPGKAPLSVGVSCSGLELAFLSGAIEAVPRLEGRLDAKATVSGALAMPTFVGHARLTGGRVAVAGYGEYRELELELDGSDEAVTLERLYAKAGAGWATLSGAAQKRGEAWQARLSGEAKGLPIIVDDQLKATASLGVEADGFYSRRLVELRPLKIPHATIELPDVRGKDLQDLERPESIVLVRNGVPLSARQRKKLDALQKKAPAHPEPSRIIRMVLDAPQNLWVKSSDVNAEAGLSEGFKVEIDQVVSLSGEVHVKQGRLAVIGRRFDLDPSSTVRFSGPPQTNTNVNIIATHRNEREGVTVTATVVGQLPQFNIHLSSSPALSETDIFALIATGRRTLKQGGSAAITNDQVASVLGAFAAAQLRGVLGKKLPLDVLSIEAGSEGIRGTRVEGGKYLTDTVYLGVEGRYGADPKKGENDFAARLQWQFVPHWSLEAYGGNAAYGGDVMWSREY